MGSLFHRHMVQLEARAEVLLNELSEDELKLYQKFVRKFPKEDILSTIAELPGAPEKLLAMTPVQRRKFYDKQGLENCVATVAACVLICKRGKALLEFLTHRPMDPGCSYRSMPAQTMRWLLDLQEKISEVDP